MGSWRDVIGHDGYFAATLRLTTPDEGGRSRAVQSGYHAQWWSLETAQESWRGSGPLDIVGEARSIKPGQQGEIRIYPMDPSQWHDVAAGAVLHLRERVGQTLGVAVVTGCVRVPQDAPLRLEGVRLPAGAARLSSPKLSEHELAPLAGALLWIPLGASGLVLAFSWFVPWPPPVFWAAVFVGALALGGTLLFAYRSARVAGDSFGHALWLSLRTGLKFLVDFL
jgi:hypothetical protein